MCEKRFKFHIILYKVKIKHLPMSSSVDLVLKDLLLPNGRVADISVDGGFVVHMGASKRAHEVINCMGMFCLPGAIDMHVHVRGGEQSYKENWQSCTESAVAGGVTTIVDQPNTVPPIINRDIFAGRVAEAGNNVYCNYAVNAGVTPDADLEEMWSAGALAFGEIFAAPSSYGSAIGPEELGSALERIHKLGALATIHAEEVLDGRDDSLRAHCALRPGDGEGRAVSDVCSVAPEGAALHFCHLSSRVSLSSASCGTFEVMPHHLFLSYEMFDPKDGFGKVNPPLRSEKERKELWGLWERIDVIASDHAPHTIPEKSGDFESAPAGIPGVETMVPLLLAKVLESKITLDSVIEKTVSKPASILQIIPPGLLSGERADIAVYPRQSRPVDPDALHSRSGWTPYEGMDAVFPEVVIVNGNCVFNGGETFKGYGRWIPGRGYKPYDNK